MEIQKYVREGKLVCTIVEIVFFPSVARIRHLNSIFSPAVFILFLLTLDLSEAEYIVEGRNRLLSISSNSNSTKIILPKASNQEVKNEKEYAFKDEHSQCFKVTHTEPFSVVRSNILVSSLRKGSGSNRT